MGYDAVIDANAVVLEDVPSGAMAVGIPARIILRDPARAVANAAGTATEF